MTSDDPFKMAHGVNQFEYSQTHPAFLEMFKASAKEYTTPFAQAFLENYHGLASVHKLVDVGGSSGEILSHIVQKHPHIHGVNFDLPEVVAENPNIPGKCLIIQSRVEANLTRERKRSIGKRMSKSMP